MTGLVAAPRRSSFTRRLRATTIASRLLVDGRWRRTLMVLVIGIAALVTYDKLAVEFMHDRRQDALVSQFNNAPTSDKLAFGDAVAVLQIPKISVNTIVSEGESHATLRAGPAHRGSSVMPGARGNAVIVGKAFRYGEPFARLEELAVGSEIYVKLRASDPVRYLVDTVERLPRNDATPFESTDDATLTLVTSTTRLGGESVIVRATASGDAALVDTPAGSVAPASEDRVSFTDLTVVAIWAAVCASLAWVVSRSPLRLGGIVRAAIFAPIVALAALQFTLALERLVPTTV